MHPNIKPDGFKYYEYIIVYVDDLLIISHQNLHIVNMIKKIYNLKGEGIRPPKTYLGLWVKAMQPPYDASKIQWSVSA
jgi:hypothetical protein